MNNTNFQTIHQMGQAINDVVRQATGRDAVQNIDMDHITVAQNKHYEETSVSGRVVSFTTKTGGLPLEKCIAQIEPVQDLHGYDNPWPAGGGVNKANLSGATAYNDGTYGLYITVDENAETITLAGTWSISTATATWRFLTVPNITNGLSLKAFEQTSGNHVNSDDLRWDGTTQRLAITCRNMTQNTAYTIVIKLVAYEGETAPTSWTPYSNICPISGWTGCNISHSGADTSDPTVIPISWQSEAGTVYGGTLDVTTGVLTVDRAIADMGTLKWNLSGDRFSVAQKLVPNPVSKSAWDVANPMAICSAYKYGNIGNGSEADKAIGFYNGYLYARDTAYSSAEDFRTGVDGVQLVYHLATPITYQLTPQEIRTLLGTNNIWADTGDIEVTYKDLKELY